MSAEIIQFGSQRPKPLPRQTDDNQREAVVVRGRALTTTAKSRRLRDERKKAWRRAEAITDYWKACLRFMDAASCAADHGLREDGSHADRDHAARWAVLDSYRAALGKQLVTPAPDTAAVTWKRAHLTRRYIGVEQRRLEQAIADDVAFLSAHPTRNVKAKAST